MSLSPSATTEVPGRDRWPAATFFRSLSGRLTLWYAASAFALVAVTLGLLYAALTNTFDDEIDGFLKDTTNMLVTLLREKETSLESLKKEIDSELSSRRYARVFVRVTDSKGAILVEAHQMSHDFPDSMFMLMDEADEARHGSDALTKRGRLFRLMATRVHNPENPGETHVIQVAYDRKHESGILHTYRRSIWIGLSTALLACAIVGYFIAHRGIRPVQQITQAAGRVTSSTLHERLETRNLPTEIQTLAGTFNTMLDRLEESFRRVSQFSADIAHELRTPLGNLRGGMEVALGKPRTVEEYRDVLGSALEECERLTRLVDRLLFIARTESAESRIELENLDVTHELSVVREFYEAAAADAQVKLTVTSEASLRAPLNRELFQSAIGNLIANALRHTPPQGEVAIAAARANDRIVIIVSDTGCGIPAEHLPHVFDRFYRVDDARSAASGGVGLGLALVRSIAKLHQAELQIQSEVGKGTRVTLAFRGA